MWNLEKDPALRSSFMNITILDHLPDLSRLRRRLDQALPEIPRLRQRVVAAPARLGPPSWADDPCFDLDYHIRHLAVPSPGTERQLLDLAAALYEDPFDRARPLWQFTVVEGLADGRAALLSKLHHTVTDGIGGLRISMLFLDVVPDAPDAPDAAAAADAGAEPIEESTSILARLGDTAAHQVRRQLGIASRTIGGAVATVTHPQRLPQVVGETVETVRSLSRQVTLSEPARSSLWAHRRSLGRRFEALNLDLDAIRRTAKALGGTVNDVYVTGLAGAAGAYHRAKDAAVDELRVSVPISTRVDRAAGGNAFTPVRVLVPAGIEDPVRRFQTVRDRLGATKRERAIAFADTLAAGMNLLPTAVAVRLVRSQVETVDFAASNLRGAPFDLYVAGARVVSNHPMGPTGGTAFNATVLGYLDSLGLGLNVDEAAIEDPTLLRQCIVDAFDELASLG